MPEPHVVTAPAAGLGSNSNYIIYSGCKPILGLSITMVATQDFVLQSDTGPAGGFGLQLNGYSPPGHTVAWQQYAIVLLGNRLVGYTENWPATGGPIIQEIIALATLPSSYSVVPAGSALNITLETDGSGNITGAVYTVTVTAPSPRTGTPLAGNWSANSVQHVYFVGQDGNVDVLSVQPGTAWVSFTATPLFGRVLPAPDSPIISYVGTDSTSHVNYFGTDGHVHELLLPPNAPWSNNDLTAASGGSVLPAPGSSLHSYWGDDASQHVNFVGTDGHIHELYILPGIGWRANDLTLASKSSILPRSGSPIGSYEGAQNSQHLQFIGTDGHIHEIYANSGTGWATNDLTQASGAVVLPAPGSPLCSYLGGQYSQHLNFIGTDGHVHEIYANAGSGWASNDLTVASRSAVLPRAGSSLHSYPGGDSSQHINFIGTDGHLHEIFANSGSGWAANDLTSASGGGVLPLPSTALTGYWGGDNSQHVNFVGTDGNVHELYLPTGKPWINNDLTALATAQLVSKTQTLLPPVTALANLAPLNAFELNLVGPINRERAVLSSGTGDFIYRASTPLTVLNVEPSCTESTLVTGEMANTFYGTMNSLPHTLMVQSLMTSSDMPMIEKTGPSVHQLKLPPEPAEPLR